MVDGESGQEPLDNAEQGRLDDIFTSVRSLHYLSFVTAGISLGLSSLGGEAGAHMAIGGLTLPSTQAAVGLYLVTIILAALCDHLYRMAKPWVKIDPRRPPFPWFPLQSKDTSPIVILIWLFIPVLLAQVATAMILKGDSLGSFFLLSGYFLMLTPRLFHAYVPHIRDRTDVRGGEATFSVWLLYWLRLVRSLVLMALCLWPILAAVPRWQSGMISAVKITVIAAVPVIVLRLVGSLIYRRIDRMGTRYGFPPTSVHYEDKQKAT